MIRILSFDPGLTTGFATAERGKMPLSGSHQIAADAKNLGKALSDLGRWASALISEIGPTHVILAEPFINRKSRPDALLPLYSFMGRIEEAAFEGGLKCLAVSEQAARRAFMGFVPGGTKATKIAAIQGCKDRGWPCCDNHAADALIVAGYALAILDRGHAHESDPLFRGAACQEETPGRKSATKSSARSGSRAMASRKSAA